jgi:hypothetical protein
MFYNYLWHLNRIQSGDTGEPARWFQTCFPGDNVCSALMCTIWCWNFTPTFSRSSRSKSFKPWALLFDCWPLYTWFNHQEYDTLDFRSARLLKWRVFVFWNVPPCGSLLKFQHFFYSQDVDSIYLLTYLLTHGAESFWRSHQLCSYSRISQHFMEP